MTALASWGQGAGIAGYALTGAEVALRLLLPPRLGDDTPTTWTALATALGRTERIDAFTSWTALTELDGHKGADQPAWSHPEGRLSDAVAKELVTLLSRFDGADGWHYSENADRGGSWTTLTPAFEHRHRAARSGNRGTDPSHRSALRPRVQVGC